MGFGSHQWESAWNLGGLWTMGVTLEVGLDLSGFSPNPNSLSVSLFSPVSFLLCLGTSVRVRVKCWDGSSMVYACVGCYLLVWCSSWSWGSGLVIDLRVLWQRLMMGSVEWCCRCCVCVCVCVWFVVRVLCCALSGVSVFESKEDEDVEWMTGWVGALSL